MRTAISKVVRIITVIPYVDDVMKSVATARAIQRASGNAVVGIFNADRVLKVTNVAPGIVERVAKDSDAFIIVIVKRNR